MTRTSDSGAVAADESPSWQRLGRWLLLVATPLLLGAVLWVHPHGGEDVYDSLAPVADTWLLVHLLLLPLFGLLGICLYVLLDGYEGFVATIGRIGTAVYLVCYLAFEAIAGIATGILVRAGQTLPLEQQAGVAEAIQSLATDPIVAAMALVGTAGATVAVVAIGVCLRRADAPLVPVVCLVGVPITLVAHGGGFGDVFGVSLFLVAVVWLELGWRRTADKRAAQAT